jgi:alpha-glucosidase
MQWRRQPFIIEAPAPHFISSRLRALFLESTECGVFDMRPTDHFVIKIWSGVMRLCQVAEPAPP